MHCKPPVSRQVPGGVGTGKGDPRMEASPNLSFMLHPEFMETAMGFSTRLAD